MICLTAMHRDVARRYPTVDALRSDLERFLAGLPVRARGDSFGYLANKFVRRHAVQVGIAAAAIVLLVGVVSVYTWRLNAEREHAQRMAGRAQRVQQFMQDLFRGDDEQIGPSDTLRVVTLLQRGIEQAAALASEPEAQADLRWTLGRLMLARGQVAAAESLLSPAYQYVARSKSPDPEDLVGLGTDLGMLRAAQERWADGERLLREATALAKAKLPPDNESAIHALACLGSILMRQGKYTDAEPVLNEAIARMQATGEVTDLLIGTVNDLAILRFDSGGPAADSLFRYVAQLSRRRYGDRHPNVAHDLIDIAAVEQQAGRYEVADSLDHEALGIMSDWYGADSPNAADVMSITARNLLFLQRYDEAGALFRSALAILERAYGPEHSLVGKAWGGLASVAEAKGDAPAAEAAYKRAAGIARRAFGAHHLDVGVAIGNLGTFYMHHGQLALAERCFRESLAAYEGVLTPDAFDRGVGHLKLGRALLMQERVAEAEKETSLGYRIIAPQADTTSNFLRAAINDLYVEYTALGRPADAARFRPMR
ncbi:MAG: tetratricopeptide repeat protein [Candidatus Eisenbacteria bacterium]